MILQIAMALVAIFALLSVASVVFIYLRQVNSWHASEMGLLRSDRSMIQLFEEQNQSFRSLVELVASSEDEGYFDLRESSKYKRVIEKLGGLELQISRRRDAAFLEIPIWECSLPFGGSAMKGYYFTKTAPLSLEDSLDECVTGTGKRLQVRRELGKKFRLIEENWYIFYEFAND